MTLEVEQQSYRHFNTIVANLLHLVQHHIRSRTQGPTLVNAR